MCVLENLLFANLDSKLMCVHPAFSMPILMKSMSLMVRPMQ
jgi:hypothetical protein